MSRERGALYDVVAAAADANVSIIYRRVRTRLMCIQSVAALHKGSAHALCFIKKERSESGIRGKHR